MKPREFHIWGFPEDRVRILFRNHQEFIKDGIEFLGSLKALANFLGVSPSVLSGWKKFNLYIPLWAIKKIVNKLHLDWFELEKNVLAYKGINTSLPIKNPILPIKETPELFAIMAHLIGDGSVNKNQIPMYINSNKDLINNFVSLLKKTFGGINANIYKTQKGYQCTSQKIIVELITNFYDVKFDSLNAFFPKELFDLPENFACATIRAITDDEGALRDTKIEISMKNKRLIFQIRSLIMSIFGQASANFPHKRKGDGSWSVIIRSSALNRFKDKINLVHSKKKKYLEEVVKKRGFVSINRRNYWDSKIRILELLKSGGADQVKGLASKLPINCGNITVNLNKLRKRGFVQKIRVGYGNKWFLTEKGLDFLKKWSIKDKKEVNEISDWRKIFKLSNSKVRIVLTPYGRKRLFWMLRRLFGNQDKIADYFQVHRNTISNWETGKSKIPLTKLTETLNLLYKKGIDLSNELVTNVYEIRSISGRYKIRGGYENGIDTCRNIAA